LYFFSLSPPYHLSKGCAHRFSVVFFLPQKGNIASLVKRKPFKYSDKGAQPLLGLWLGNGEKRESGKRQLSHRNLLACKTSLLNKISIRLLKICSLPRFCVKPEGRTFSILKRLSLHEATICKESSKTHDQSSTPFRAVSGMSFFVRYRVDSLLQRARPNPLFRSHHTWTHQGPFSPLRSLKAAGQQVVILVLGA
jgi:hypothetical protein